jgi:hypothetical protein
MRRNHPVFTTFDPEDSCIVSAHRADARYRERLRSERKDELTEPPRYLASDDDLPEMFWPREQRSSARLR